MGKDADLEDFVASDDREIDRAGASRDEVVDALKELWS